MKTHSHVHVFVQFGSKVARHLTTAVVVSIVLWDVVHIMEDQAVPVQVLHGLQESHIKQHGSVEGLAPTLKTHTHKQIQHHNETGAAINEKKLFEA